MIPNFKCTEEAVAFGRRATVEQVEALKDLQEMYSKKVNEIKSETERDLKTLDMQMIFATRAQFCREAIEGAQGRRR
jgi:hypothetical protein